MILGIARKLKESRNLVKDPEARQEFKQLMTALPNYTVLSSYQFVSVPGLFNTFIEHFLNSHAYIINSKGVKFPSYDPIRTGYTEAKEGDLVIQQWLAVWSNVFIVHTEYPTSPDLNVLIIAIDNETYNTYVKVGKEADGLLKQSVL